ncbi:hypothetical protein ABZ297_15445, partial [Nonomuraea sp. NPDC005983]|uniref:hypothetical protein n=1 Tax=Nonomuraea sp. NPDC005983 TaxID=3155595 RepID=UPI0033BDF183
MTSNEHFDDLEAELTALGAALDVPTPPQADVAAAVRARLTADAPAPRDDAGAPAPRRSGRGTAAAPGPRGRRARWKVVTAVLLAVVAITAAT